MSNETSSYLIGLDLGDSASAIAYFDQNAGKPALVDISGGYGKPVQPTAVLYIPQTDEWVFGEYALLSETPEDTPVTCFIPKPGRETSIGINGDIRAADEITGRFVLDLAGNICAIDPKAVVKRICVCVPDSLSADVNDSLSRALAAAGFDDVETVFLCLTDAIFINHVFEHGKTAKRVAVFDYGHNQVRGGIYEVIYGEDGAVMRKLVYMTDDSVGGRELDKAANDYFTSICEEKTGKKPDKDLSVFTFENKEALFRTIGTGLRLYYNFCTPAFAYTVTKEEAAAIIEPFSKNLSLFLEKLTDKYRKTIDNTENAVIADTVILSGGGFETQWAKDTTRAYFKGADICEDNPKAKAVKGAALYAAMLDGALPLYSCVTEDTTVAATDYGIMVEAHDGERYIPLASRSSDENSAQSDVRVIINKEHAGRLPIPIYKRENGQSAQEFAVAELTGLPIRPKGAMFLVLSLKLANAETEEIILRARDDGFGQFFEKTDYCVEITIEAGSDAN